MKNKCPYRTSDSKCTHRYRKMQTEYRKKHFCPYNNENKCDMYNEWDELRKIDSELPHGVLGYSKDEGEL